jgi:hypothetical protein
LSQADISSALTDAGYRPTISGTPGVKIGQAQNEVATLAQQQTWAWIVELGTNDAGARDSVWSEPFLVELTAISPATCVVYVTVSERAGPVALQIDSSIDMLAASHPNVHVLDWGTIEYQNPAWVTADGIHPTPEGQAGRSRWARNSGAASRLLRRAVVRPRSLPTIAELATTGRCIGNHCPLWR